MCRKINRGRFHKKYKEHRKDEHGFSIVERFVVDKIYILME